jgi:uncharacterized protein
MTVTTALALLAAGIGGGLASTIASVVSYPILLSLGLPPLSANVTNTVSLVLTGLGSVLGSRPELAGQRARVIRRLPVRALRLFIAVVGFVLAVKLALSAYR